MSNRPVRSGRAPRVRHCSACGERATRASRVRVRRIRRARSLCAGRAIAGPARVRVPTLRSRARVPSAPPAAHCCARAVRAASDCTSASRLVPFRRASGRRRATRRAASAPVATRMARAAALGFARVPRAARVARLPTAFIQQLAKRLSIAVTLKSIY